MSNAAKTKTLIGQIVRTGTMPEQVRVRITKLKLDKFLLMYFNDRRHLWAVDKDNACRVGDIVLLSQLPEAVNRFSSYEVKEIVYKVGEVVDPVSGRRCRGTEFIDTPDRLAWEQTQKQKETEL